MLSYLMHRRFSMGIATSERSQAPARQGHFVVTAELPEIQTVTVWTPCCVPMNTLSYKKNLNGLPLMWSLFRGCSDAEGAASVARCKVTAISRRLVLYLLYIAIYMYNLMLYLAKNVWWK